MFIANKGREAICDVPGALRHRENLHIVTMGSPSISRHDDELVPLVCDISPDDMSLVSIRACVDDQHSKIPPEKEEVGLDGSKVVSTSLQGWLL